MRGEFERRRLWLVPLGAFVAILVVFGWFWLLVRHTERRELGEATSLAASQAARRLESFVETRLQLVELLRAAADENRDDPLGERFAGRAETYRGLFPGIVAINWIDARGVIRQVVPREPNLAALGRNLFENASAAPTLRAAAGSDRVRVTPPLELYQGGRGFAVYRAVRFDDELVGFVNAAFRVQPVVDHALREDLSAAFHIEITDGDRPLYAADASPPTSVEAAHALAVGDRTWQLQLRPRPVTVARFRSGAGDLVLAVGVGLAALVALLFRRLLEWGEQRLRASARYRGLVEDMPALICRWRPDTTLTFVNAAFASSFGRRSEALVGRSFLELIPEDARPVIRDKARQVAQNEEPAIATEQMIVDAEGRVRWHEWRSRALTDPSGRVIEIQSIGVDTTERRRAEEALGMSEERFRTVFGTVTDAILILDETGERILDVNEAGERLFGVSQQSLIGVRLEHLIHGEPPAELRRWLAIEPSTRVPIRLEWRSRRDDAMWWVAAGLTAVRIGGLERVLCVVRDASDQKLLEEQLLQSQKMETVGTLAGGLAHDVNNVLTAILGYAEQARERTGEDAGLSACLDSIVDVCRQGGSITRSLLTFSQRGVDAPEAIDTRRVVAHAVELLRPLLPDAIELSLDGAEGPAIWVDADRTQLQQIVMNLVLNARDAMPGGGRLEVSIAARDGSDEQWATLVVTDDGRGMNADVQRRVIEPFFTTKSRGQGTGLGMSIVHGIVTRYGGRLAIESTEGEGTQVTIDLPRCAAPPSKVELEHAAARAAETIRPAHGTVLLIEDNAPVREVLARGLAAQGYDVLDEADGESGLRVFEQVADRLSLVVVDVDLPRKGGPQCVREMQARRGDVPTILISGNARTSVEVDLGERVVFLQKPFRVAQLAELGQRMIDEFDPRGEPT